MNDRERLTSTDKSGHHHLRKVKQLGNDYASKKVLIQKLGDYENAEEKGELLRVPCKVGDKVYYFSHRPFNLALQANTIYEAEVIRIVTIRLGTSLVIQIRNEYGVMEVAETSSFGKTVFLTREEAEKALKGE